MFCKNCGKEVNDNAVVCIYCGCSLEDKKEPTKVEDNEPKTTIGVLMALFLGIIGLIIGLCLYKEGTQARETFMKGFWTTFLICVVISIVGSVIYFGALGSLLYI